MRVALIKEHTDPFGPWQSKTYPAQNPLELLSAWPFKATYFELTTLWQADWFVVPMTNPESWLNKHVALYSEERRRIFDRYASHLTDANKIPWERYDCVISFNPFLKPPRTKSTLFCYFLEEHIDPDYLSSMRRVAPGYDLFLDHMLHAGKLRGLGQGVDFPYPRDPVTLRRLFNGVKEEAVWLEARTIMHEAKTESIWTEDCDKLAPVLARSFPCRVDYEGYLLQKSFRVDDPPVMNHAQDYLSRTSRYRYFVSLQAAGAGQALVEAASMGAVCIGSPYVRYHKWICHPRCRAVNVREAAACLKVIAQSADLADEIRSVQDNGLRRFGDELCLLLEKALRLKRRNAPRFFAETSYLWSANRRMEDYFVQTEPKLRPVKVRQKPLLARFVRFLLEQTRFLRHRLGLRASQLGGHPFWEKVLQNSGWRGRLLAVFRSWSNAVSSGRHAFVDVRTLTASETALVICDVWDRHWHSEANARLEALAPRIDTFARVLRERGVHVIHAPSETMHHYQHHPARVKVAAWDGVGSGNPAQVVLPASPPLFQPERLLEAKGPDNNSQHPAIGIEETDVISASGAELKRYFDIKGIQTVLFVGTHSNVCMIDRDFGVPAMLREGKRVIVVSDLVDCFVDIEKTGLKHWDEGNRRMEEYYASYLCPVLPSRVVKSLVSQ